MKCVNCQTDNNLRERIANYGKCKNCRHTFVFEPTKDQVENIKITDVFFDRAIADISANKTLYFTAKQFQYFLDRRLKNKSSNFAGFLFGYIFFSIWLTGFFGGFLSILLGQNLAFASVYLGFNLATIAYLFNSSRGNKNNYRIRQINARQLIIVGILISIVGLAVTSIAASLTTDVVIILLGIISIILGSRQLANKKQIPQTFFVSQTQIKYWLDSWQKINGSIEQLLPPTPRTSLPRAIDEDITKYSFDRAVICDSAAIAKFLIANNFHFENNCAVLSITGYPESIFNTVRAMLQRNPNLTVYALHDASPRGVALADNLRSSGKWFANAAANIYDFGILPKQILKQPNIFVKNSPESARLARQISPRVKEKLDPEAIKWLESGNFVELESFSPQRLLQIVSRGIVQSDRFDSETSNDPTTWEESQRDAYFIYSIDTFG